MAKLDKLINYAYFKEECDLPKNIEDQDIEHKIYRAQEMLRMLIGDQFYQDFLANYKANTLSEVYTQLYPYIKQFIAWQAHEFWLIKANFNPTRSGIRVHTEENSEVATDTQMAMLHRDAKQQAQYYKKLLIDYLNCNSSNYPLYMNHCHVNLTGNSFHISAVKNKRHDHDCRCNRCCH